MNFIFNNNILNDNIFNNFTTKQLHLIASQCNIDFKIYYLNFLTNKYDYILDTKPIIINKLIYFFNNNFSIPKPLFINNCHSNPYCKTDQFSLNTNICLQNFSFNNHNLIYFLNSINLKLNQHLMDIVVDKWINTSTPFNFKNLLYFFISNPYSSFYPSFTIQDTFNSCLTINNNLFIPFIFYFIKKYNNKIN